MKELVEVIAKALVSHPEAVVVTEKTVNDEIVLTLSVDPSDMGKVIGKQGRIAKAIRTVLKAQAIRDDVRVSLDID
ncbi:MAG: KH domain-containing protein [Lachnospiraceae bacterium]|nr:KH domain-containing protein [Lachnospiraceae bacterium]MBQ6195923.1 KH domain-containing protein [Lachnospiraceae bacterium]